MAGGKSGAGHYPSAISERFVTLAYDKVSPRTTARET